MIEEGACPSYPTVNKYPTKLAVGVGVGSRTVGPEVGYLYFHKAPNAQEFMDETMDKLARVYMLAENAVGPTPPLPL